MFYGQQVLIRPIERDDLPFLQRLNADPSVRGRVVGWGWPQSFAGQVDWFEAAKSGGGSTHRWVVERRDGGVIGMTGLWDIDWHNRNALTALKLGGSDNVAGKGLGTDAIKALMAFAFYDVGLERLYGSILEDNVPSIRAYCDKSGWQEEGRARRQVWRHGKWVDLLHVGALKSDFDSLADAGVYRDLIVQPDAIPNARGRS